MVELRRRARWRGRGLLVAAVVAVHLWLMADLAENRVAWGAGDRPPARIEVAFVRELQAAAPPAAPPPAPPAAAARLPAVAKAASAPASAPDPEPAPQAADSAADSASDLATAGLPPPEPAPASAPLPASAPAAPTTPPQAVARASEPTADSAAAAAGAASAAAAAVPATAASAPHFGWPPSTRLSFNLNGNFRGAFEGSAQVDWLRVGPRYQVHLETSIGPLLSRHITSEGELGAQGLVPRKFVGEQKVMLRGARRWSLSFGPDKVVLADGRVVDTLPGVQDEASQFVQLTWLFTQRPDLLKVGRSVEMPLAISRKVERWIYAVVAEETLRFPFGDVPTFHLKPSREAGGGDMTAEIWIAPTLQYLPVRILIRQNQDNWVDLMLQKPPLQAADGVSR